MSLCELFGPEFCPLFGIIVREFYSAEDLGFLDRICGIIERLEDVHQRTLARSALVRTCMKNNLEGNSRSRGSLVPHCTTCSLKTWP